MNLTKLWFASAGKFCSNEVKWRRSGKTLTCDRFRAAAQGLHEGTHGVQFPPETGDMLKLRVIQEKLLDIRVYLGQTRNHKRTLRRTLRYHHVYTQRLCVR